MFVHRSIMFISRVKIIPILITVDSKINLNSRMNTKIECILITSRLEKNFGVSFRKAITSRYD